MDMIMF